MDTYIVTKENFEEVLEKLRQVLPSASFISIDEEMTGIFGTSDAERIRRDDVPSSRYQRMLPVAGKYRMIQFGLCLFHEKGPNASGSMEYQTTSFTFYLFPDSNGSGNGDLTMSIGAIEFLKKNNMDFGKWIDHGIPYVSRSDMDFHRKKIFKAPPVAGSTPTSSIVLSQPGDVECMEKSTKILKDLVDSEDPGATEVMLPPYNPFLRRYLYQVVETLFADSIVLSKSAENPMVLKAQKVTIEQKAKLAQDECDRQEAQFRKAIGFAAVYDLLTEYRGPIVGHNCLFDILFLLKWLEGPLPGDFAEFRALMSKTLPRVYDTKFLAAEGVSRYANGTGGEDTTLQMCYEKEVLGKHAGPNQERGAHLTNFPVFVGAGVGAAGDAEQFHDAGWDAYCTGCLFATQKYIVESMPIAGSSSASVSPVTASMNSVGIFTAAGPVVDVGEEGELVEDVQADAAVQAPTLPPRNTLEFYRNKLFMMRSMFHINLDRAVPMPREKDPVSGELLDTGVFNKGPAWNEIGGYMKYSCTLLYVSGFAPSTNNNDLILAFTGGSSVLKKEQLYVSWIDQVGVFVQINVDLGCSSEEAIRRLFATCAIPEEWEIVDFDVYLKAVHVQEADRVLCGRAGCDAEDDGDCIGSSIAGNVCSEPVPKKARLDTATVQ
jgi:hypothetical protein